MDALGPDDMFSDWVGRLHTRPLAPPVGEAPNRALASVKTLVSHWLGMWRGTRTLDARDDLGASVGFCMRRINSPGRVELNSAQKLSGADNHLI